MSNQRSPLPLRNELDFEQWYVTNAFDYERNPLGSHECSIARKAWHAALDAQKEVPSATLPNCS